MHHIQRGTGLKRNPLLLCIAHDIRRLQGLASGITRIDVKMSMDPGCFSEDNVNWAEKNKFDVYIATGRIKHNEKVPKCPRGRMPEGLTIKERMARKLRTKAERPTLSGSGS